ncbi:MAG: TIGR03905 family TSCPD domain-containing protein [Clostridiaceae bacterium]
MHTFIPTGICSREIKFSLNDGIINDVEFIGGCSGNLQGISKLIEGMNAEDAVAKLRGISCGMKDTSCPDQLAIALEEALLEAAV